MNLDTKIKKMKTSPIFKIKLFILFLVFSCTYVKSNSMSIADGEGFSLRGKDILLDGKPFYPRGYVFESFINKRDDLIKYASIPEYEEYCVRSKDAQDFYFGDGNFAHNPGVDLARVWGANTLRFNLNQSALDPENEFYSQAYVEMIQRAVKIARDKNYSIILTLFGSANKNIPEPMRNENPHVPMNTKTSLRAAVKLAELYGNDPYIMLELINEPYHVGATQLSWSIYIHGGIRESGTFKGWEFVGVNTIIKTMRDKGAKNLIIIQGVGATFKDYPGGIVDPLNKIVYSVHPFFGDGSDPSTIDWDGNFGFFADQYPFLITAWGAPLSRGWCPEFGIGKPLEFLDYLRRKKIGLMAYAMDVPFSTVRDFRDNPIVPTTLGTQCTTWAGRGAGEVMRDYFLSYNLTSVDELSSKNKNGSGVSVYPNPVTDNNITIRKKIETPAKLLLYNLLGELIFTKIVNNETTIISNLQLTSGIYLLKVESDETKSEFIKLNVN